MPGTLLGKDANNLTLGPVNFRNQQGVYVLYDENYRLVYVGQAGYGEARLFARLRTHHRKGALVDRWTRFSWFGLCKVEGKNVEKRVSANATNIGETLDHMEGVLISAAEPPHNRQGAKFGTDVKQYIQHRDDDNLGPSQEEMIKRVWKEVNSATSD